MAQSQVLGLDIGSEKIRAVIAEPSVDGKVLLRAGFVRQSKGLRRGAVVDMESVVSSVGSLLDGVRAVSKNALKNIYLRVGSSDVRVQSSRGITAVSRANSEIYKDDIDRVVQASEAINLPPNREILHTIKREFIVDGVSDIQDPIGMVGARLEVISLIIDDFQPTIKNISKCVELSGGNIGGLVFGPLASSASVLTNNQKELGVVLIDIGYGTTGITVYEENKLLHTKVFPFGANHITTDLAVALKIPVDAAEKIKLSFGHASSSGVSSKDKIDLQKIDGALRGSPSRKFISEVIEARCSEIFDFVNDELKSIGKEKKLPGGAVICGGGAKLPGIVDLSRDSLKLVSQIGLPLEGIFETQSQNTAKFLESPEYANVLGLVLFSDEFYFGRTSTNGKTVVNFLKNFLP